jgi:hypothetical protein
LFDFCKVFPPLWNLGCGTRGRDLRPPLADGGHMRTPRRMPAPVLLAIGLTALVPALPASAGVTRPSHPGQSQSHPGQWTQITSKLTNIKDVGLVRGADGVLHVLWATGPTGAVRVSDTPISASGAVGRPVTIAAHIFAANDPDATATPKGLDAFWNEVKSSAPNAPTGIFEATRPVRGGSWRLGPVTPTRFDWQSSESAAPGTGSAPWTDFISSSGITVHHSGHPVAEIGVHTCCVDQAGIGTDSKSGAAWVTYLSTIPGHAGLFAQRVTAAGTRSGTAIKLPGSYVGTGALVINQRVTATGLGRHRPGVYVVYRTGALAQHVELYQLGTHSAVSVGNFGSGDEIGGSTLAADPFGRLWVAWFRLINNRPALSVRRAKAGASQFGQTEAVALPKGTANVWKVYLSPQAKKLDVLALLTLHGKTAYWTTQVLPPKQ